MNNGIQGKMGNMNSNMGKIGAEAILKRKNESDIPNNRTFYNPQDERKYKMK